MLNLPPASSGTQPIILFLCTGNYYRSRMAEEIFNHLAEQQGQKYQSISRGLAQNLSTIGNFGSISLYTVKSLESNGYPVQSRTRLPISVSIQDWESAALVICLNQPEHQPMVNKRFPQFAQRVVYWNVPDEGEMPVAEAFRLVQKNVKDLLSNLDASLLHRTP